MGAALYTAQRLYGPQDRDGTLLLKPGQHGYTVLGQIYGKVKLFEDHFLNLYRYEYNTPFINKNDSRMTPNTFEGYTLQGAFGGATTLRHSGTSAAISPRSRSETRTTSFGCRGPPA